MLAISIPGFGSLSLQNLVLDYNGTLAVDGGLIPGVRETLNTLSAQLAVHVVTADTFGIASKGLDGSNCRLTVLKAGTQDRAKADYVDALGAQQTVSIGNGRNDALMLAASAIGIAVIIGEGASTAAIQSADIVCTDIVSALELLVHPLRLTATLRC